MSQELESRFKKEKNRYRQRKDEIYERANILDFKNINDRNSRILESNKRKLREVRDMLNSMIFSTCSRARLTLGDYATIRDESVYVYNDSSKMGLENICDDEFMKILESQLSDHNNSEQKYEDLMKLIRKLRKEESTILGTALGRYNPYELEYKPNKTGNYYVVYSVNQINFLENIENEKEAIEEAHSKYNSIPILPEITEDREEEWKKIIENSAVLTRQARKMSRDLEFDDGRIEKMKTIVSRKYDSKRFQQ